ncbi:M56 family metallopeptidase [Paracnuella aquatica]|uniref:M56 family metallopeptidase n=1 Tax=Paracnuella aquatica TaxID=2268757 RepID=UPI000DEEDB5C|nr:M56 family metallopeptidase [Paracnuella aquatica]RPD46656.1 M56 family metallopeptidase [Paracnuella aquatica]
MTAFSQSALLQALGWATLNSLWQVGLLWCGYVLACRYGSLSAGRQFRLAALGIGLGVVSFAASFWVYLQAGSKLLFNPLLINENNSGWLPAVLTAASVAYLLLLVIPAARLFQNWRFLRKLRRSHLGKAPVQYRVFVQKISGHLGLRKPVGVYLSALVNSPVTIGFVKPLILLPVASFNQLSIRQAEAILLHELAHIRRFDFVFNIAITVAQTLLYFNPFIRLFVQAAETSRERSCDNLVLQFDYDRVAYASALLQLEKTKQGQLALAMGAAGKSPLFQRIQEILGMQQARPVLKMQHLTGLLASMLCILALHSLFIAGKTAGDSNVLEAVTRMANPLQIAFTEYEAPAQNTTTTVVHSEVATTVVDQPELAAPAEAEMFGAPPAAPLPDPAYIQVAETEVAMPVLSADEQQKVQDVISSTKKVLPVYEWKKLEKEMADGLTEAEKMEVQQQYNAEMSRINWERMQQNLTQNYHQTDLDKLQIYLKSAEAKIKQDSLIQVYNALLVQLEGAEKASAALALPDLSRAEIEQIRCQIRQTRDSLLSAQKRPVVKL